MPTWFNTWVMYLALGLNYIFIAAFGLLPQRKYECLNFRMMPPVYPFIHKENIYWACTIRNNAMEKITLLEEWLKIIESCDNFFIMCLQCM